MELLVHAAKDVAISPVDSLIFLGLPVLVGVGVVALVATQLIVKVFRRKGGKATFESQNGGQKNLSR